GVIDCGPYRFGVDLKFSFGPRSALRSVCQRPNPDCLECRDRLSFSRGVPSLPAARMQPHVTGWLCAVGQQRIVAVFKTPTPKTPSRRRPHRMPVQPFHYTGGECLDLGVRTRQSIVELGNTGAFIKKHTPVLG